MATPWRQAPPIQFACRFDALHYANGELFRVMFANERRKPRERATIAPIAAIDKRNADYAVAKEKYDTFAGDTRAACVKDAKVRFGQS